MFGGNVPLCPEDSLTATTLIRQGYPLVNASCRHTSPRKGRPFLTERTRHAAYVLLNEGITDLID